MHLRRRSIASLGALLLAGAAIFTASGAAHADPVPPPSPTPTPQQRAQAKTIFEQMIHAPGDYVTGPVTTNGVTVTSAVDSGGRSLLRLAGDVPGEAKSAAIGAVLLTRTPTVTWNVQIPDGAKLETTGDGSVIVVNDDVPGDGNAYETTNGVAAFAPPQARDATGKSLPTSFEAVGTHLIQHVDTYGAAFPVVVDPWVTGAGWYGPTPVVYVMWSRGETESLYHQTYDVGVASAALGACGEIPNTAGKIACGAVVAWKYADFKAAINSAHDRGVCLKARVPVWSVVILDFYSHTC